MPIANKHLGPSLFHTIYDIMKNLFLTILLLGGISIASASPLSPEEAYARLGDIDRLPMKNKGVTPHLSYTSNNDKGEAVAYIFSNPSEGFTIVSANDKAMPLLGYSNSGNFDSQNIPPALKWLLETYADQLVQAEKLNLGEYVAPKEFNKPAIEPMIKTKWDQLKPYYNQTPVLENQHCPTGCVATSLAQTMNYFKYPESGEGRSTYTWGRKRLTLLFDGKKFDWTNMLDTYTEGKYTDEQAEAVSFLMKATGYSVQMDYAAEQSGAYSERIVEAVTKYFKYDPNTWYATRNYYSQTEWYTMIYENLRDCGPVIYNGTSPLAGGHSFICDGYDGQGYFHINWGWSGLSDGYFSLDILGPQAQGIGGSLGNFSFSQDAVLGMKPASGAEVKPRYANIQQCGASTGVLSSGNILTLSTTDGSPMGWYNPSAVQKVTVSLGIGVENMDGKTIQVIPVTIKSTENDDEITGGISIQGGYYISSDKYVLTSHLPDLKAGEYRLRVLTKDMDSESAPWQPILIPYGYANYVYLTVGADGYAVRNVTPQVLDVKEIRQDTPLYRGKNLKFTTVFENPTDIEITACVTPCLVRKGKTMYQASSRLITVAPKSTLEYEWITNFYTLRGADDFYSGQEFTLELKNQDNQLIMGKTGEIGMKPTPANLLIVMNKLAIENVETRTVNINGTEYSRVYVIPDYADFKVDFDYTIKKGYFDTAMTIGIYERDSENGNLNLVREIYHKDDFLDQGTTCNLVIPANFPEADTDKIYYLRAEYMYEGARLLVGQIPLAFATSDISEIQAEDNQKPEYFTLQGIPVTNPAKGQIVIVKTGSKVTKSIIR